MTTHNQLPDAGLLPHVVIDAQLPTDDEKDKLQTLAANAPQTVTGARSNAEQALANLLSALETLGVITDNTTAS